MLSHDVHLSAFNRQNSADRSTVIGTTIQGVGGEAKQSPVSQGGIVTEDETLYLELDRLLGQGLC
jgi:hypothetical protein